MRSLIGSVVWKEMREIRRDPVTIWIAIVLPLVMLYLFGSALSLDVKEARFAVHDLDKSEESRALIDAFRHSGYFRLSGEVHDAAAVRRMLDRGEARMVLVIPPDFSRALASGGTTRVQTLLDGSFSATAMIIAGYAEAIVQDYQFRLLSRIAPETSVPVRLENRVWFNAPLKSENVIVPGLFAVILMAFPPLLTALAIAREKESGSVQQIFASPIRVYQFILGKTIPYAGIAFIEMVMILAAGLWGFGLAFQGSVALFLAGTLIYVVCTVGLGLLVSAITRTQLVAMLLAFVVTIMPSFLFSGFLFPIFTMPEPLQLYTYLFPARYFIEISRGVIMKGAGLDVLWPQFAALLLYSGAVFATATWRLRKKVA